MFIQSLGPFTLEPVLQEEHLQLPGWQVQLVQVQEALEQAIVEEDWIGLEKGDRIGWSSMSDEMSKASRSGKGSLTLIRDSLTR